MHLLLQKGSVLFCFSFPCTICHFLQKQSCITGLLEFKKNVFLACVLPSMPPTLSKSKKEKTQKTSMTVFSLDGLVSGVLFQFEMQSWGVFFCHKRHETNGYSVHCSPSPADFPLTPVRDVCVAAWGAVLEPWLGIPAFITCWNQWPGSSILAL